MGLPQSKKCIYCNKLHKNVISDCNRTGGEILISGIGEVSNVPLPASRAAIWNIIPGHCSRAC